jgi:plasmid stability protein
MRVNLSIKNAPDQLVATLKARAAQHYRSRQGELMAILESAVQNYPVFDQAQADKLVAKIRAMNLPSGSEAARMIREDRDGGHTEGR